MLDAQYLKSLASTINLENTLHLATIRHNDIVHADLII